MATYRYWQHFLALEADFAATARYVEIAPANFGTFSIEYAKLLLAVCSEIDVLCKIICEKLDPTAKRKNIDDYRACLAAHTQIAAEEVHIRRHGLTFTPWADWVRGTNPSWWHSYNRVKHQRDVHFADANLDNCANAIGALFPLVLYCHKAEGSKDDLEPTPVLLGRDKEPGHWMLEADYTVPDFS